MRRHKLCFLFLIPLVLWPAFLLTGCGDTPPPQPSPTIVIRGEVVHCWALLGQLDVLLPNGELKAFYVARNMPNCGAFSKGGVWTLHLHSWKIFDSTYYTLDWMKRDPN
jgi:hypothetical protein